MSKVLCVVLAAAFVTAALLLSAPFPTAAGDPLPAPRWIGLYDLKGKIGLRWHREPALQSVRIYRRPKAAAEEFRLIAETGDTQYIDNDARSGVPYTYRLAGVAADGTAGPFSEARELQIFFKISQPVTAPAWEGYLVIDGGIGLKWQRRPDQEILAHNIYRKKAGAEELTLVGSSTGSSYLDEDVTEGTEYVYVIRALDKTFVESAPSPELVAVVPGVEARPARPAVEVVRWRVRRTRHALTLRDGGGVPFFRPSDLAVDARNGLVYVVDSGNRAVVVFHVSGRYLRTFGEGSSHAWVNPVGISVDGDGQIYVADAGTGSVKVMSQEGVVKEVLNMLDMVGPEPTGIVDTARGRDGRLIIVDNFNNRVVLVADKEPRAFGRQGFEPGNFSAPGFCAVDREGRFYVSDALNNRVQVFDGNGLFLRSFGADRQGPGGLGRPKGLALSGESEVLVADSWQNVVQVFDEEGRFVAFLGDEAGELLDLGSPNGLAVDGQGRVWIAERLSGRVQVREIVEN